MAERTNLVANGDFHLYYPYQQGDYQHYYPSHRYYYYQQYYYYHQPQITPLSFDSPHPKTQQTQLALNEVEIRWKALQLKYSSTQQHTQDEVEKRWKALQIKYCPTQRETQIQDADDYQFGEERLRSGVAELENKCVEGWETGKEISREIDEIVGEKNERERRIESLADEKSLVENDLSEVHELFDEMSPQKDNKVVVDVVEIDRKDDESDGATAQNKSISINNSAPRSHSQPQFKGRKVEIASEIALSDSTYQQLESRSFWKAGAYETASSKNIFEQGELEHARVHPKFLHSNATSHKWAFRAIAKLLDNTVDEICNGTTYVMVDRIYNKRDNSSAILRSLQLMLDPEERAFDTNRPTSSSLRLYHHKLFVQTPEPDLLMWKVRKKGRIWCYAELFQKAYLVPIYASIWSCFSGGVMNFSAYSILSFCRSHHLLQLFGRPQWLTIRWRSCTYVNKVRIELEKRGCQIRNGYEVRSVLKNDEGLVTILDDASEEKYEGCIGIEINSRELVLLLLSSYGATLSAIDLEIYNLISEIESIDKSCIESLGEMDYLWGIAASKVRKEQEHEHGGSSDDLNNTEAVGELRKIQFRENFPVDPKMRAATILNFPCFRAVGEVTSDKLQKDNFEYVVEGHSAENKKMQTYDPVFIMRFSVHCLSMGYVEPLEFASSGLLAITFASLFFSLDDLRQIGCQAAIDELKTKPPCSSRGMLQSNLKLNRLSEITFLLLSIIHDLGDRFSNSITLQLTHGERFLLSLHVFLTSDGGRDSATKKIATELVFRCSDLESKDLFSKSDTFLMIAKIVENGTNAPICKTEIINDNRNPMWKPVLLKLQQIGSKDSPVIIECFDFNSNGKHDLLGKVQNSLAELEKLHSTGMEAQLFVPAVGQHYQNKVLKSQLFVVKFSKKSQHTFLDYLAAGYELNFMVAIDFTASNGNPHLPDSLHYIDPSEQPMHTKDMLEACPNLNLEDKVLSNGEGNVTTPHQLVTIGIG